MGKFLMVAFAAFLGGTIQAASGFGSAAVMMVFVPLVYDMLHAPALCSAISCILAYSLAFRFRKYVSIRRLAVPVVACLTASTIGIQVASNLDLNLLSIMLGVFLILLALYFFTLKSKLTFQDTFFCAAASGLLAGVGSGLFSVGGPMIAAYYLATSKSNEEYIGNMQAYFAITNSVNIITRMSKGLYTAKSIFPIAIGVVGVMAGKKVGIRILEKMDAAMLTKAVYAVIALSGALTVISHI